jgi:hypothetical protein
LERATAQRNDVRTRRELAFRLVNDLAEPALAIVMVTTDEDTRYLPSQLRLLKKTVALELFGKATGFLNVKEQPASPLEAFGADVLLKSGQKSKMPLNNAIVEQFIGDSIHQRGGSRTAEGKIVPLYTVLEGL